MATTNSNPVSEVAVEKEKTKRSVLIVALIIFGILALISICCVLPMIYGAYESSKTTTGTTSTSSDAVIYNTGDSFTLGDFTYRVVSAIDLGNTLTNLYGQAESTSGTFFRIDFSAENNGSESNYIGVIELSDEEGNEYSQSTKQSMLLSEEDGTFLQVNPGMTSTFMRLYEIPADTAGLQVEVSESILGGDKAVVDLGL